MLHAAVGERPAAFAVVVQHGAIAFARMDGCDPQGGVCVRHPESEEVLGGIGVSGRWPDEDKQLGRSDWRPCN